MIRKFAMMVTFAILCAPSMPAIARAPFTNVAANGVTKSEQEIVNAREVRACMKTHHLRMAEQTVSRSRSVELFQSCQWPLHPWSQQDGYSEIVVRTMSDSERSEASDSNDADYIKSSCRVLKVVYDFGDQGAFSFDPPTYPRNGSVWFDGHQVTGSRARSLLNPFGYPARNEVVELRNDNERLISVTCTA